MSTLALVRHGQASFFADNYDQLSPLGEQQARLLGEYWLRRGVRFDEVYTGPRVRQIETAALAGEAFTAAGISWPEPKILPELDEHQVDRLIKVGIAGHRRASIRTSDPCTRPTRRPNRRATSTARFSSCSSRSSCCGCRRKSAPTGSSPGPSFSERVREGLARITAGERRGRSVAAFTLRGRDHGLHCKSPPAAATATAFDLGWRVRNCLGHRFRLQPRPAHARRLQRPAPPGRPSLWTYR